MADENPDSWSRRYFRAAAQRHWDPHEIPVGADVDALAALDRRSFTQLRGLVAMFGAGEESVTEDLVPLAATLDRFDDQLYVTSQLYDEAKHAAFFDRYWREAIVPAEKRHGLASTEPTAEKWFSPEYRGLFDRIETAMARLTESDTPETRARAYCHYHLTAEGILGQTAYHCIQQTFASEETAAEPSLPGLTAGFENIQRDEGRHVGFGMAKLKALLERQAVDPAVVTETLDELSELVDPVVGLMGWKYLSGPDGDELVAFARQTREDRLDQLTAEQMPSADALVGLEGSDAD